MVGVVFITRKKRGKGRYFLHTKKIFIQRKVFYIQKLKNIYAKNSFSNMKV